jgi:hypothetical protein
VSISNALIAGKNSYKIAKKSPQQHFEGNLTMNECGHNFMTVAQKMLDHHLHQQIAVTSCYDYQLTTSAPNHGYR